MAILVAGLSVLGLYGVLWLSLIGSGGTDAADFTAFYTGWTIVLEGDGARVYDPALQAEVQQRLLGGRTFEAGLNPFNNPPHLVLPFVPLALLPLQASYLVWGVIQLVLLGWLLWRLWTAVSGDWSTPERVILIGAAVALPSIALTLLQGAFSLLITVAVLELYLALRQGRDARAGWWFALGTLKPQGVAGLGVMLLAGARWRTLLTAAAVGTVTIIVASVVLGPGIWQAYLSFLGSYVDSFDALSVRPSVMWNVRGTLAIWLGPTIDAGEASLINDVAVIVQVAGLAGIAALWFRRWDPSSPTFGLRFGATLLIGILTSPHLNPHDGLLLIPAIAVAYGSVRDLPIGRWIGMTAVASSFLVLLLNPLSVNEVGGPPVRVPVLAMGILLGMMLVALQASRRRSVSFSGGRA
jgi:hypothetical protein